MGGAAAVVVNDKKSATPGAEGDDGAAGAVMADVLAVSEQLEVAGQVIEFVAVDMVHDLIGVEVAARATGPRGPCRRRRGSCGCGLL